MLEDNYKTINNFKQIDFTKKSTTIKMFSLPLTSMRFYN